MSKYVCSICGFIYDEAAGYPEGNISPETLWENVPSDFICPLCGASKEEFTKSEVEDKKAESSSVASSIQPLPENIDYSFAELSALFSNLAKGSEKQYDPELADLYQQLSNYYNMDVSKSEGGNLEEMKTLLREDLSSHFSTANQIAAKNQDRGSLRALKWAEQVSRMNKAHLDKMMKASADFLKDKNVYVCDICGFIYTGDEKPEVCPVCKVPSMKMTQIKKGA